MAPRRCNQKSKGRGIPASLALALATALFCGSPLVWALEDPSPIRMLVDGVPQTGSEIRLPRSAKSLSFEIGQDTGEGSNSSHLGRVRYKLDGYDADWRERPGVMWFNVCFLDHAGGQLAQKTFVAEGQNSGWRGAVDSSVFTSRLERVVVPERAAGLLIKISSAGPPTTVGVYLVKDISIHRLVEGKPVAAAILDSSQFLHSENAATTGGTKWLPDGTRPSMARRMDLPNSNERAFCIIDDDATTHAEWRSSLENAPEVHGGEQLLIEWKEAYAIGEGGITHVRYDSLPSGHYRFSVQELDVWGHPTGAIKSLGLAIPAPYWKEPWFWFLCSSSAFGLLLLGGKWWIRARVRSQLQKVRLVEQERLRIARDLHDDLGARLTHISLMSSHAGSKAYPGEATATFQEISGMTRELIGALSEVIWTVNPENDHLEALVSFLCQMIYDLCEPAPIRCRVDAMGVVDERPVRSETRHNISLAVKEAVNNVLKHSHADELLAQIRFDSPILSITISDNGTGAKPGQPSRGNGMLNMKRRMAAINGSVGLESGEGKGTTVRFEVPIV